MQEEWGHELPAEEGVYTGEVVTGEVVGEVVSGGPVEGEVYGKVVPVEVAGEQPAARIDLPPGRYPATGLSQWKWGHKPHGSAGTYRAHNVREGGHWQCEGHPGYRGRMQPISEERRAVIAGRHQNALRVWEGPYGDKGMYENGSNEGTQRWMLLPEGVLRVDHIHWGWAARGSTDYEAGGYTYYFAPPQALLDMFGLDPGVVRQEMFRGGGGPLIPAQDLDGLWLCCGPLGWGCWTSKAIDHDTKDDLFCWLCLLGPCPERRIRTPGTNNFYKSDDTTNVDHYLSRWRSVDASGCIANGFRIS